MGLSEDLAWVGALLDTYDRGHPACGVTGEGNDEEGVPPDMRGVPLDSPGWVACLMLPSTLTGAEIEEVERQFRIEFPPLFRAYLLARFHLHGEVRSRKYGCSIGLPELPSRHTLRELARLTLVNCELIEAGYIPFASWGPGYGPMCFDASCRADDGDCSIVWMDHELLASLGPDRCRVRAEVEPLARPLYRSFRELLPDVFTRG